jgi:CheY-like chemotaxis protein
VTSEYGKGSNFHIEIPQQVVDSTPVGEVNLRRTPREETARREDAFAAPKLSILAVDDTPMNLKVLAKLLKDTGVSLDAVMSGAEALRRTAEKRYDLILMDHQMPEMDGIECLHRIRAQEDGLNRDSKIVCLTANVGKDMERLYMQEGFDGYLEKPIRGKVLEAEIMRLAPDQN